MGQAVIKSKIGGSEYTVQILKDTAYAESNKLSLETKRPQLIIDKTAKLVEIQNKQIEIDAKKAEQDALNPVDFPSYLEYLTAINLIAVEVDSLTAERGDLEREFSTIELQVVQLDKEVVLLTEAIEPESNTAMFCADLYEGLSVDDIVPIAELRDEWNAINKKAVIMPQTFRARNSDITLWQSISDKVQTFIDALNAEIIAVNDRLAELAIEQTAKQFEIDNKTAEIIQQLTATDAQVVIYQQLERELETLVIELNGIIADIFSKTELSEKRLEEQQIKEDHKKVIDDEQAVFITSASYDTNFPFSHANSTPITPIISTDTGVLQPTASSGEWSQLWNLLVFSAYQKWQPKYRIGKITAIDFDTQLCSVLLETVEDDVSSLPDVDANYLNINQQKSFDAVPIQYGHSGGFWSFEVADLVVVNFNQDIEFPVIIGFEKEPKPINYFSIVDRVDYLSVFYWDTTPQNVEAWETKLQLLDENKTLFDVYVNSANYDVILNGVTVAFNSDPERLAQYYSSDTLTECKLFYPPNVTETNKPVLKISQRVRITVPQTKFDVSHYISLVIVHKLTLERVIDVELVLSEDFDTIDKFCKITELEGVRLAPNSAFSGDYFELKI